MNTQDIPFVKYVDQVSLQINNLEKTLLFFFVEEDCDSISQFVKRCKIFLRGLTINITKEKMFCSHIFTTCRKIQNENQNVENDKETRCSSNYYVTSAFSNPAGIRRYQDQSNMAQHILQKINNARIRKTIHDIRHNLCNYSLLNMFQQKFTRSRGTLFNKSPMKKGLIFSITPIPTETIIHLLCS